MKQIRVIIITLSLIVSTCLAAHAMGGPPEQEEKFEDNPVIEGTASQTNETGAKNKVSNEELGKATIEIIQLEAKLERVEDNLDVLSKKMAKAKAAGDNNKLKELQKQELASLAEQNALKEKIEKMKEKYPELRISQEIDTSKPGMMEKKTVSSKIIYHYVQMGDTMMSISRRYFNTPVYYREIARMNNITDTGYVPQGTRMMIDMNIPNRTGQVEASKKESVPAASGKVAYHTVAKGDTMMSISRKYFNTPSLYIEIARRNGITDIDNIPLGTRLRIDLDMKE